MKYDIFLSHSSADQEQIVTPLYEYLTANGLRCFYSRMSIPSGESYTEMIPSAIKDSAVFFLVFTEASNSSDQVKREAELANAEKKPLFCMKCSEQPYNNTLRYVFSLCNWFSASGNQDKSGYFSAVLAELRRMLAGGSTRSAAASAPAQTGPMLKGLLAEEENGHDPEIQYQIGRCYETGTGGTIKNFKKAFEWYLKPALEDEYIPAINAAARMLDGGYRDTENGFTSETFWHDSAEAGDPEGLFQYAEILQKRYEESVDSGREDRAVLDQSMELYMQSAAQDYIPAIKAVGHLHYMGKGNFRQDWRTAIEWYTKAAEAGDVEAMLMLGDELYAYNKTADQQKAIFWLEKAADNGSVKAMRSLAYFYETRTLDGESALVWHKKAFEVEHDGPTACHIGGMYSTGENGVVQNFNEAFAWFKKGEALGDMDALTSLAECFEKGLGTGRDLEKARAIYQSVQWKKDAGDISKKFAAKEAARLKKLIDAEKAGETQ